MTKCCSAETEATKLNLLDLQGASNERLSTICRLQGIYIALLEGEVAHNNYVNKKIYWNAFIDGMIFSIVIFMFTAYILSL